jgi:hypothetical protein
MDTSRGGAAPSKAPGFSGHEQPLLKETVVTRLTITKNP